MVSHDFLIKNLKNLSLSLFGLLAAIFIYENAWIYYKRNIYPDFITGLSFVYSPKLTDGYLFGINLLCRSENFQDSQ